MTTDDPEAKPTSALQQRRFMHLRWDLDKTHLRTEFDTLKDLIATFRQKAEDKVAIAGATALLRALLDPRERTHRRVTFISGSPRQMRKVLAKKLELDGVEPDLFILKPNLENLLRGRFRALRGQVGYKLKALLISHMAAEHVDEYLFGDDAEQDAFIYSLYADILAGRVDAVSLAAILNTCKVYRGDIDEIMAYHRRLFASGEVVRRIFIHLERRSPLDRFAPYGGRVCAIYNYFQCAIVLFEMGALEPRGLLSVIESLEAQGYTPQRLANSLQDLMRRGVLHYNTVKSLAVELSTAESTMGRPASRFLHAFEDTVAQLEDLQRPGPRWEAEINYLGLYHEARFRRQQHRFLGIRLLD
jgi:hypothetical protein